MGDDTTVLRRLPEGWTSTRIVGSIALAVTILVLVLGASLVGGDTGPYEDPGGRIAELYAGEPADMLRAFAPGTIRASQRESTENAVRQIVRPGVTITEVAEPVEVAGVAVVRVTTDDGINWCVRPDGAVLPGCRVGEVPITATTDAPIRVGLALAYVPLEGPAQLTVTLEPAGEEPLTLTGLGLDPVLGEPLRAELVQAVNVVGGQGMPVDPQNPTASPGARLFLTWLVEDELSGRDLELTWDGGSVALDLGAIRWFVG